MKDGGADIGTLEVCVRKTDGQLRRKGKIDIQRGVADRRQRHRQTSSQTERHKTDRQTSVMKIRHTGWIAGIARVDGHTTSYFKACVSGWRHLGSGPKVSTVLRENQFQVRLKGSQVT